MPKGRITLFGGSGFIGRYAARVLVEQGWQVRVACRRLNLAADVRLAGPPGWVEVVQANIRDKPSVTRALEGADAVINLVGILQETSRQSFHGTQAQGARNIAEMAADMGISKFIQISAIGADETSNSAYARSKAAAERSVQGLVPSATILRPSVVFGPEDNFLNRFAGMARFLPGLPAIGGGKTKVQPVYAGDVADAIAAALDSAAASGKTFELGGPHIYSFKDIYRFIFETIDRKRLTLPLPFFLAKPMGMIFGSLYRYVVPFSWGFFGEPPLTGDQVELLRKDNVVSEGMPGFAELGITQLETIEAIAPAYLWRFRSYGQFHKPSEA